MRAQFANICVIVCLLFQIGMCVQKLRHSIKGTLELVSVHDQKKMTLKQGWQDYVNNYLINVTDQRTGITKKNVCESAAIVDNHDGTVWAASNGFTLGKYSADIEKVDGSGLETVVIDEFANLLAAFNNNGASNKKGGVRMNKDRYFVVSFNGEEGVMYLKKNGGGACVAKSNMAFVIATFNTEIKITYSNGLKQPQNPGKANEAAEDLQRFLIDNGL